MRSQLSRRIKHLGGLPEEITEHIKVFLDSPNNQPHQKAQNPDAQLLRELPATNDFKKLPLEWVRKARDTPTVIEVPNLIVPDLRDVDCDAVLAHLLSRIKDLHRGRYADFLESEEGTKLQEVLWNALIPPVKEACKDGSFTLERLRSFGGEPQKCKEAGIYLHILWKKDNPDRFWLYVGQAINLSKRIGDHEDSDYRRDNPSLHYYVWDMEGGLASEFVTLAIFNEASLPQISRHYILNLEEMWMACILQTLRATDLEKYLPQASMPWAGFHLNIAPPIWQRFPGEVGETATKGPSREDFIQLIFSGQCKQMDYAEELRKAYHSLCNSPDKRLRQYYLDNQRRASGLGTNAWQQKKYTAYQTFLEHGVEKRVKEVAGSIQINLNDYTFIVNRQLKSPISPGDLVHIQLFLTETPSPLRYCQRAQLTDPSSRLLVLIKASDELKQKGGEEFHRWLFCNGWDVPRRMNSLVDTLEGMSYEQSVQEERRIRRRREDGKLITIHS
ncbi:hypothetical protein ASPZODRAFT_128080 [Penicilliopsis zonata CBS 506.65]|uniref:GIY-YIG domain-containing protein n=1 Tax=Penicilliopsis zonata CBS 506.65 TaxID=1073090 RepID=A0A1L9SR79_9EURO|nr:hypothetical protein ASPZODRAFT_128080 [Penicilliopsis zonata CBS 506.65]OJJ49591.1 hypothetical protein ASPZODRAFT_128080 [Penicilliopsis zonata CBS 506.65]